MCLMCEHYMDSCDQPECIASAHSDDVFNGRSLTLRLWRGYNDDERCPHMIERDA